MQQTMQQKRHWPSLSVTGTLGLVVVLVAGLSLVSTTAYAQYKWKDGTGQWVFSDQPPPNNAKTSSLSGPNTNQSAGAVVTGASPLVSYPPRESKPSRDDRELAIKRAESDAQATTLAKQKLAKQNQQACDQTRDNLAALQSDRRVRSIEGNSEKPNSEKPFLDDNDRQKRLEQAQKDLRANCQSG